MLREKTGMERKDVAEAYPEFSEGGKSGFAALANLSSLPEGDYPVLVYVTTSRGFLVGRRIRVHVKSVARRARRHTAGEARLLIKEMQRTPVISILMPVFETPERWLHSAIRSVQAQIYPHWELCIADDCSPSRHVRSILEEYAR